MVEEQALPILAAGDEDSIVEEEGRAVGATVGGEVEGRAVGPAVGVVVVGDRDGGAVGASGHCAACWVSSVWWTHWTRLPAMMQLRRGARRCGRKSDGVNVEAVEGYARTKA